MKVVIFSLSFGSVVYLCFADHRCRLNEVYRCKDICPPLKETCLGVGKALECSNRTCLYKCYCRDGYLRENIDTACMPMFKCPQFKNTLDLI